MIRTLVIPAAALALAACQQGDEPAPPPEASVTATAAASEASTPAPVESLVGEYRLAGLDGREFDESYGVALSISEERIDFDNCRQIGWTYTLEDGRIETERSPPGGPDAQPCDEQLPVRLVQLVSAIDQVERVERTPENGIVLRGRLRSVTLFSQ